MEGLTVNLRRILGIVFLLSVFSQIIVWGFFMGLSNAGTTHWVLLGVSLLTAIAWVVLSLAELALWIRKRSTQFGLALILTAVGTFALMGVLNFVASKYNKTWDVTKNKVYSLNEQSLKILGDLKDEIEVRVWTQSLDRMSANVDMRRFLENYRLASGGKLTISVQNPNNDPMGSQKDNITRDNVIVVEAKSSQRQSRIDSFNESKAEEQLTNALIKVIKGERKRTVCFLSGHGQLGLNSTEPMGLSSFRDRLREFGYEPKETELITQDKVGSECEALITVGPQGDLSDTELERVQAYLAGGGKLLAFLGPGTKANWIKLVGEYGVELQKDVVFDQTVNPPIASLTNKFAQDVSITQGFDAGLLLFQTSTLKLPTSNSFRDGTVKAFVHTNDRAVALVGDLRNLNQAMLRGAKKGPFIVGALASRPVPESAKPEEAGKSKPAPKAPMEPVAPKTPTSWLRNLILPNAQAQGDAGKGHDHHDHDGHDHGSVPGMGSMGQPALSVDGPKDVAKETTVIVMSSIGLAANNMIDRMGNTDFVMNSVSYLLKEEDVIGIRPRELRKAQLQLSNENVRQVISTVLIIAGLFLVGAIRASRRKNAA